MQRQRGSIVVYLLFSIVASAAAGYGIYRTVRARRLANPEPIAATTPMAPAPISFTPTTETRPEPVAPASTPPEPEPPPDAAEVKIDVEGALSKDVVVRTLEKREASLKRCFDGGHATVTVSFTIGSDGTPEGVIPLGTDRVIGSCVAGVVRRTIFPPASDETSVPSYIVTY